MSQIGIGAMLHMLNSGSSNSADKYYGREIMNAVFTEDVLTLHFSDGTSILIFDDGQSCCESRYMTTDDNVSDLVGNILTRIEVRDGGCVNGEYDDCHEQMFLEIGTNQTSITICTHNEHNGYYGGFGLTIKELK